MSALRARAGVLVLLGLVATAVTAPAAGAASRSTQTPILECVFHDTGTGEYNSLWGYDNTSSSTEDVPVGSKNKFTPSPHDQGQPTSFSPGRHDNVFVVTWDGSATLKWSLGGHSASAKKTSTACSSNPVPLAGGGSWWVLPGALLAIGIAGAVFCARRFGLDLGIGNRAPPVGPAPRG
jgi:hypothetical protein